VSIQMCGTYMQFSTNAKNLYTTLFISIWCMINAVNSVVICYYFDLLIKDYITYGAVPIAIEPYTKYTIENLRTTSEDNCVDHLSDCFSDNEEPEEANIMAL
jgi:hypothetical protein